MNTVSGHEVCFELLLYRPKNATGGFRANGAFSQRSLSICGNAGGAKRQHRHGEDVKEHLLEQMRRVPQPPEMRKNSDGPKGKSDFEREKRPGALTAGSETIKLTRIAFQE